MDKQLVWSKIQQYIKGRVSAANFRTWFLKTKIDKFTKDKMLILVPSAFVVSQLKNRYLNLLTEALKKEVGQDLSVEFVVNSSQFSQTKLAEEEVFELPLESKIQNGNLNPRFTLENFVVGLSNNVAYAAAEAVVQNPGTSYNPLLFYGGTGVGKTHLMLGIGNALLKKNLHLKIIYCSSEQFMNDYVSAIQNHRMGDLRAKYRSPDILLVDDIQFFAGREGTQEEFFHTFNELQGKNSQIVLTSDRPPHEITKLEDRLKSRFQGGLMVDIQSPDFDTRVAILQAKCRERGEILPEEALRMIASSEVNIRELEGKLIQILQGLKTKNLPPIADNITPFLATRVQKPIPLDHKKIISAICDFFSLTNKDLVGPRRVKELVLPRQIVMYLLSEEVKMTVEKIGQVLGGRDHTTVMHGRDKLKRLIGENREIQRMMIEIKQKLSTVN